MNEVPSFDVAVVGAGAAGLAAAIFAARAVPHARIVVLDGARTLGAKILVSGGGRCNVTNSVVTEADFNGGRPTVIHRVLAALPVPATIGFFAEIGVALHEESLGKLFPDSNRARTVLDALLAECRARQVEIRASHRVTGLARRDDGFEIRTGAQPIRVRLAVLATGGRSLPKSGSDGFGYELARALGHRIVPTTPALAPLRLDGDVHRELSGVSHPVVLTLSRDDARPRRVEGSLLWTHFGLSGPAALDLSRYWHRAELEGSTPRVTAALAGHRDFRTLDRWMLDQAATRPKRQVANALADVLPAAVGAVVLRQIGVEPARQLAQLTRDERRSLVRALDALPLAVTGSRGYHYAEATAGGVDVSQIEPATMASRTCPGLFLVGEILDVDGRLGGFNFQWAWSSAKAAARGIAAALA